MKAFLEPCTFFSPSSAADPATLAEGLAGGVLEDEVVLDWEVEGEAVVVTVFADAAEAEAVALGHTQARQVIVFEDLETSGAWQAVPREEVKELALSVAVDASNPEDLPAEDAKRNLVEEGLAAARGGIESDLIEPDRWSQRS